MKRILALAAVVAFTMTQTGCVSTLLSVATGRGVNWGSGSGSYDYDDSIQRSNQQQADLNQQGWLQEQQVEQTQDAANQESIQASIDAGNAAAASAAAASAAVNP